ncbi:MAG: hypothetical protein MPJ83_06700 [Gammaproteobacteria bacterium]|nr:hypothetical protein [Gammaproteobacteria bacterium]MDA8022654.1 hypothetical protein [Gammaproteobacteria bacterium]
MAADSQGKGADESGEQKALARHPEEKFMDILEKEVENRRAEILLRKEDSQNRKEYSMRMIDAQAKDREHSREVHGRESTKNKVFVGVIFFASMLFAFALIWQGQAQLAEKLITLAVSAGLGWAGGYGYAMRKSGSGANRFEE